MHKRSVFGTLVKAHRARGAMSDISAVFRYGSDTKLFYRTGSKRGLKEKFVVAEVLQMEPTWSPNQAQSAVDLIKSVGLPYATLFAPKQRVRLNLPDALKQFYTSVSKALPIRFLYTKHSALLYYINEQGEYVHWASATPDSFLDCVISNDHFLEFFRSQYDSSEVWAGYLRSKLQLADAIKKVYEGFRTDPTKRMKSVPRLLAWDRTSPAYKVLDPQLLQSAPTPAWDSFLSRVDLPEVFMAYIWSIFEESNKGRQCLWMYGHGHDGKSTVINAFLDWFGRQHSFMIAEGDYQNAFFFGKVHGKRVGAFMDCTNPTLLRQGRIKQILGGDTVDINDKFQTPFSAEVYARLFILSNEPPQIVYEDESQRTRLLVVRISKFKDDRGDANFRQRLVDEMPAFLAKCKQIYPRYFTTGFNMKPPEAMDDFIKTVCATVDSDMLQDFIAQHLKFGPKEEVTKLDLVNFYKLANGVSNKQGQGTDFGLNAFIKEIMGRGLTIERRWNEDRSGQHRVIVGCSLRNYIENDKIVPITKNKTGA